MSIKTHGCYGEVEVPENSVGRIIIDELTITVNRSLLLRILTVKLKLLILNFDLGEIDQNSESNEMKFETKNSDIIRIFLLFFVALSTSMQLRAKKGDELCFERANIQVC